MDTNDIDEGLEITNPENPPFHGFLAPRQNWIQMPSDLFGLLVSVGATYAEFKVVYYVIQHTKLYGERRKITLDEFSHGLFDENGERMDSGTGLSRRAVQSGIKSAIEHGFVETTGDASAFRLRGIPHVG